MQDSDFESARRKMVAEHLRARGIRDPGVLAVMQQTPREIFLHDPDPAIVYGDHACDIGCEQTISQPYIVALMSEALQLTGQQRVLEIGTGSGYQTAVLAQLAAVVFTIERHESLSDRAKTRLASQQLTNIQFRVGDGTQGWPEEAPFERIIVTAGAEACPRPLLDQLAAGGRLIGPFGGQSQQTLQCIVRVGENFETTNLTPCRFVPLVGS